MIRAVLILFFGATALASSPELMSINADTKGDKFISELVFNQKIDASQLSVEFINETVQVNLPNAHFDEGKRFTRLNSSIVRSLFTYQYQPDLLRFRVIFPKGSSANLYKNAVYIRAEGKSIFLEIDKNKVATIEDIDFSSLASVIRSEDTSPGAILDKEIVVAAKELNEKSKVATKLPEKKKKQVGLVQQNIEEERVQKDIASLEAEVEEVTKNEANKSEADIPVFTQEKKIKESTSNPIMRMLLSLAVILCMGLGAFLFGKKWIKKNPIAKSSHGIKVLTQHHMGPKKSLAIVQVAGESILIGITDHSINHIRTLSLLDEEVPEIEKGSNFDGEMKKNENANRDRDEEDEFEMGGIKELISGKLRGYKDI